ncbi:dnaJ-like protein 60 [Armigeres subalbatus]|uniref:dnaJ-like protein 60 n=1 Tax=Armigeres subalbatus TaxID=124917 RepID=UPI002ED61A97
MLRLTRNPLYANFIRTTQLRYAHQTNHYEVMKLQPNCTPKEIREAFIRLSKELHPDSNISGANKKANDKSFVQLLEAYKVLSKPESRSSYDYELALRTRPQNHAGGRENIQHQHWYPNTVNNRKPDPDSYYGLKGIRKVSNWTIVFYCMVFMALGIIAQVFAISTSFTFSREQLEEDSRKNGLMLAKARAEAESQGNEAQLERMKTALNKETLW